MFELCEPSTPDKYIVPDNGIILLLLKNAEMKLFLFMFSVIVRTYKDICMYKYNTIKKVAKNDLPRNGNHPPLPHFNESIK